MATFQELAADNPKSGQQYDEWREQRSQNGEDSTDYQAFRQHVMAMGRPIPASRRFRLRRDDFKAAHPERYQAA